MKESTKKGIKEVMKLIESHPDWGRIKLHKNSGQSMYIVRQALAKAEPEQNVSAESVEKDNEISGTAVRKGSPYSKEDMARIFKVDLNVWRCFKYYTNSWDVTNSKGVKYTNWQTKIKWERDEPKARLMAIKEELFDELLNTKAPEFKEIKKYKTKKADHLLEISVRDLHLGKLCWHREVGENYDIKIARKRVNEIIKRLLAKALVFGFERVVIVATDDFFNSDSIDGSTTRGTPQDNDVRWKKMFRVGTDLMIEVIEKLRQYAPVDFIVVQGNHDWERSFFLGDVLSAYYHNCKNVNVINPPTMRKYYTYGKILLGFTHGDKEKTKDLPLLMATEEPRKWGSAKYREFHIAHLHHRKKIEWLRTDEDKGVVVRQMRSLCSADAWHNQSGYVGSIQGAEAFIWDKDKGLSAMFEANL